MRIQPDNFVFPMYLGCIHFDEGRADGAAEAFGRAGALAPTNPLVASYKLLAEHVRGDQLALARLVPNLVQAPDGFKARLLLALPDWTEPVSRESATTARDPAKPARLAAAGRWLQRLQTKRLERRSQKLFDLKRYERVLDLLRTQELPDSLQILAERARAEALKALDGEIDRLRSANGKFTRSGREKQRLFAVEGQRRNFLLKRASLRIDDRLRYRDLEHWVKSYRQCSSPKRIRPLAAEILAEMADVDLRQGRLDPAIRLCEQSRAEGASGEVDWIEAQIRARSGHNRHARRLLERFAGSQSLSFDQRVMAQVNRRLASFVGAHS